MLDEILNSMENIESSIFDSIRKNKFSFDEDDMKFLNNFGDEIEKIRELAASISKNASDKFEEYLRNINIRANFRDLYIKLELNKKDDSFFSGLIDFNSTYSSSFESAAGVIIDFKPAIKKLKRQYDEYLEIENSNSIFDETKIDKKQILTYINQSLEALKEETIIPDKEKEKLIIIYKEVIKEVEKKQTNWQKVLGFFNVIAIACTIYTSAPIIKDDIIKASQEISKGVEIIYEEKETKVKVLENQSILIENIEV